MDLELTFLVHRAEDQYTHFVHVLRQSVYRK